MVIRDVGRVTARNPQARFRAERSASAGRSAPILPWTTIKAGICFSSRAASGSFPCGRPSTMRSTTGPTTADFHPLRLHRSLAAPFYKGNRTWKNDPTLMFLETVDRGDPSWKGDTGVITTLIPKIKDRIDPSRTTALMVGPPSCINSCFSNSKTSGSRPRHHPVTGTAHEVRRRQMRPLPDQRHARVP